MSSENGLNVIDIKCSGAESGSPPFGLTRHRTMVVTVLLMVMIVNYMDRAVITVLLEPIGKDLGLSDSTLGLLAGLPFAILYAFAGIPFARVADYGDRRLLIAAAVALWSIATAACGLATGLWLLFLMRVFVGIGEGAGTPAFHSAMIDHLPQSRRSLAAGLFALAGILGGMLGLMLGGVWAETFGWRWAFVFVGAPGLVIALLVLRFVPELRQSPRWPSWSEIVGAEARAVIGRLWRTPTFRLLVPAFTLSYGVGNAVSAWSAVFLARTFGRNIAEIGTMLGLVMMLPAAIGSVLGGSLGGLLSGRGGIGWLLRVPALSCLAMLTCFLAFAFLGSWTQSLVALAMAAFAQGLYMGPVFAAIYSLARSSNRATVVASVALFTNVIGLGLSPLAVGLLSDWLASHLGARSLQYALAGITTLLLPAAALFFLAARRLHLDSTNE